MTSPLSPAAQAVIDAFWKDLDFREDFTPRNIAAALRAAALCCKRDQLQLLAIADELEGN
jgi:hypothetical protein